MEQEDENIQMRERLAEFTSLLIRLDILDFKIVDVFNKNNELVGVEVRFPIIVDKDDNTGVARVYINKDNSLSHFNLGKYNGTA